MGYILLGRILEQIGGQSIDRLAQEYVFEPLGLTHTTYRPAGDVAPTERDPATGELLRGAVHDENARFLGGLSGNAGIFSDLCDMTRFVQMLALGGKRAGSACARGLTVTVLEHNPKGPGQKLLITGKGRCNVTSDSDVREFLPYVRHNGRFLYSSLYAFPPSAAMELFESLGVPLKTERGRRVFPRSDRAADVLAALRDYARDAELVRGSAKKLVIEDGVCKGAVTDRGETLRAENTLIATGGISYPATGSDGSG